AVTAVPTLEYKIAGKLSGFSEFIYRKAESQDYEYGLGTGLVYALNDRAQLDASIGVDLNGDAKSYNGGFGVAVLF
ncbi:MAG TPA: transporter, partial [Acinetobacter sp.]|nr:transporter [Acinetobacter sp.]